MCRLLLAAGSDVGDRSKDGFTPLLEAARVLVFQYFIEYSTQTMYKGHKRLKPNALLHIKGSKHKH